MDDPLRNRKSARKSGYEYRNNEVEDVPAIKTYDAYRINGIKAKKLNEAEYKRRLLRKDKTEFKHIDVNGVYGLWSLDILPYASSIHWTMDFMHTTNNICHDMINSIRPTHSGITGLYYNHKNRTYDEGVATACREEKIFPVLNGSLKPDWVLEIDECLEIDRSMNNIIGQFRSEEIVKNVMRAGKAEKSHDTVYWCIVYARFYVNFIDFILIMTYYFVM